MLDSLSNAGNVLLMLFGFGLLIAVHELGHFLAARWAGIRVHAFAIGFGQAIVSWRKGLGFRRGSSHAEYESILRKAGPDAETSSITASVSPTEYRLNWFPFGGYVKMLGQEDADPGAVSDAPDSYTSKPVWKRMIVISGGVFMNLVLAGALFIAAFLVGMKELPAAVGAVLAGSAAERAGVRAGDQIIAVDGEPVNEFKDLALATAMAGRGTPVTLTVRREGEDAPLELKATPEPGENGLLQLGVAPAPGARLAEVSSDQEEQDLFAQALRAAGLSASVPGGSELVRVNRVPVEPRTTPSGAGFSTAFALSAAIRSSEGHPVEAVFRDRAGREHGVEVMPRPEMESGEALVGSERTAFEHLLGLTPVMAVGGLQAPGRDAGLRVGDIFARIGSVEWPSVPAGMAEVRANKGKTLRIAVLRDGAIVELDAPVSRDGRIGFFVGTSAARGALLARAPEPLAPEGSDAAPAPLPASRLAPGVLPGSRLMTVGGRAVDSLHGARGAFLDATRAARDAGAGAEVVISLALPLSDGAGEERTLSLAAGEVRALHALGWDAGPVLALFGDATILVKATNPLSAVAMGVRKTHYVMTMTYLTLLRLVQGSVPAQQLSGPVGITHIGSRVADQGLVYLVFFLGLLSANLAVVNFLPVPVVDGGHMVFLAIEGLTGKPVSIAVQNAATLVGLVLIGMMFVFVTYNDVVRLFG
ncbi:MAG TPA: hypothetical protein DEB06_00575 [Phycisphaerales bacterium]|nr:hypothetical protein [Phycisphaerales bacterium]